MFLSDLFINLCILIALLFIYLQIRWNTYLDNWEPKKLSLVDGIAGGLLGNILMYFSIQITDETIIDLRYLPVMLTMLFIGAFPGFISTVLIIAGRFLFGWNVSSISALLLMLAIFIGFLLILKNKDTARMLMKKAIMMIVFANIAFSFFLILLIQDSGILLGLIPVYWIISIIGGFSSIYAVKYLRKSQSLLEKYEKESNTDFLTGLNNVRQFDEVWNQMVIHAEEKKERLSLLLIDIDHFKKVNDTYGHPVGDMVLRELGEVLKRNTRSFDLVSRNGGEEFSVILPDCPKHQAIEKGERIRLAVEIHPFSISADEHIHITVSIGAATYPETNVNTENIIKSADDCLYKAKHSGRNQVCY
ncbi:diguanylate cyclase [Bacillus haimaensis]|uniref:diguanylate cyclase n=1 Tax=Bacillus haimaensis TaxID=3160967 RepID=UPI003AA825BA